jgi:hypothetical protein
MAEEFQWVVVDARKSPDEIQQGLRARISPILKGEEVSSGPGMGVQTDAPPSEVPDQPPNFSSNS